MRVRESARGGVLHRLVGAAMWFGPTSKWFSWFLTSPCALWAKKPPYARKEYAHAKAHYAPRREEGVVREQQLQGQMLGPYWPVELTNQGVRYSLKAYVHVCFTVVVVFNSCSKIKNLTFILQIWTEGFVSSSHYSFSSDISFSDLLSKIYLICSLFLVDWPMKWRPYGCEFSNEISLSLISYNILNKREYVGI